MCSLIIDSILSDINISNDEKLMLIALNSLNDERNCVQAPYELLLKYLSSKNKVKMAKILKALESKGYIVIIRKMGVINKYKIIKDYLLKGNIEVKVDSGKDNSATKNSSNENDVTTEVAVSKIKSNYKNNSSSRNDSTIENTSSKNEGTIQFTNSKIGSTSKNTNSKIDSTSKNTNSKIDSTSKNTTSKIDSTNEITTSKIDSTNEITTSISNNNDYEIEKFKDNNINNNNINNNNKNNNNKLYINILNNWNSKNLGVVRALNVRVIDCISRALTKYSEEEIIAAINNYSKVFKSKHYYNLRWNLENFLVKENGISRFCYDGDIWLSYLALTDKDKEEDDHYFDIEQYIDG